jgi:hypothetical protein
LKWPSIEHSELVDQVNEMIPPKETIEDKDFLAFISCMLQVEPSKRKSVNELLNHQFLI